MHIKLEVRTATCIVCVQESKVTSCRGVCELSSLNAVAHWSASAGPPLPCTLRQVNPDMLAVLSFWLAGMFSMGRSDHDPILSW